MRYILLSIIGALLTANAQGVDFDRWYPYA